MCVWVCVGDCVRLFVGSWINVVARKDVRVYVSGWDGVLTCEYVGWWIRERVRVVRG